MTCVGVAFQREKGPTPEGVVGPRTWQMTRTASRTRWRSAIPSREDSVLLCNSPSRCWAPEPSWRSWTASRIPREEYSAVSAVLLPFVTTALNSLDARERGCPGEYRESARRSYRWPSRSGHRGL